MCGPASPIFRLDVRCPQRAYSGLYVPSFALVGGPAPVLPIILWGRELNCPQKAQVLGLPCWSSGWESPCKCREYRSDPCSRRIPYAVGQLGPCTTTPEAHVLWSPRSATREAAIARSLRVATEEEPPLTATKESCSQQRRASTGKALKKERRNIFSTFSLTWVGATESGCRRLMNQIWGSAGRLIGPPTKLLPSA